MFGKLRAEVRKHWRQRGKEESQRRGLPLPDDFAVEREGDDRLEPPTPRRVARRACCLAAVALRGLASQWDEAEQAEFLPNLRRWVDAADLHDEIEPRERETLETPAGELELQEATDATWRWEGAAVLAAALGRFELPPYDQSCDPKPCGDACRLLDDPAELPACFDAAAVAPGFDRNAYAGHALAIHWRLRQFTHIEQKRIDFADFARGVTWATFNLAGVRLAEGDLALFDPERGGDVPIDRASPELIGHLASITQERHVAANWLIGWDPLYGEVETPT